MKTLSRLAATLAALFFVGTLPAQIPGLINYQSRVAVGGINFDGTGAFKFALVNAAGNTAYWTNDNTHLDGTEPNAAVSLPVVKGLYSVLLGDGTLPNMQPVPSTVFAHADVRLRVWFNDGIHGSQLLTPDQRIVAVGYAMAATTANTVYGDGSAGDFSAPTGETMLDVSNPQFDNFNVPAGSVLHVPSGLTIRCSGTFNNSGTIAIDPIGSLTPTGGYSVTRGISKTAPDGGRIGGKAYSLSQVKAIFSVTSEGGGSGYPSLTNNGGNLINFYGVGAGSF